MKFGMYIEVDEWCMTVCRMTRFKVKVKVMSNWKPLRRSRPSVPHGAKFFLLSFHTEFSDDLSTRQKLVMLYFHNAELYRYCGLSANLECMSEMCC